MSVVDRLLRPRNTEIRTSADLERHLRRGSDAWSGMTITPANAVEIAAVMACVRVIAEDVGKLPAIVYRRLEGERRERALKSPEWQLIHDRPNRWMSSQAFRETLTAWALLRGNGYALKTRVRGQLRELLPLHPDRVRVEQEENWELTYLVRLADNVERRFDARDMFHLPGLSLDGRIGTGVVSLARETFGTARAAQRHAAKFFANGLQTSGVFTHPSELSDQAYQRLKASLREELSGDQIYSPLVLEEGMSWQQTGLDSSDSQFLESRKFEVTEIARWFRVAPHKIADLERATFSNIEQMAIEHVTDTIMPWGRRWEHAWASQLLPENLYAELLFEGLLRGTTFDRYRSYQIAAGGNAPWMTRNEIRQRENLDPLEGLDDILVPLNMGGEAAEEQEEPTDAS